MTQTRLLLSAATVLVAIVAIVLAFGGGHHSPTVGDAWLNSSKMDRLDSQRLEQLCGENYNLPTCPR